MTILILGATGATGKLLLKQLIEQAYQVRIIVRSRARLPELVKDRAHLKITEGNVLEMSEAELSDHTTGCNAIVSCLGHNLSWKGVYGQPRKLVTDSIKKICQSIRSNNPNQAVRLILMNTTGNRNRDLDERISLKEHMVIRLLRLLLPPHSDNEQAAEYLRTVIGKNDRNIEWVAIRPDGLTDATEVSDYTIHPSPTRSAIFDAGQTSRINVGHFMVSLIKNDTLWKKWKGQMPVIYNQKT